MRFFVVGASYRTAPLALRERLAFPAAELEASVKEAASACAVEEALLLSTCNRVELYGVAARPGHAGAAFRELLSRSRGISPEELQGALFEHRDQEALRHIFAVASSLDAIVIGEAQIAGQVKDAYAAASRAKTVGPMLSRCMHRAFATAKRVRTETEIARHPVSVSSVAADLAARVFGDLAQSTVLVVGAGEMAELAVRHLISDGATDVRVINRTHERAVELAFALSAKAVRWENLRGQLLLADIVISSTGSEQPIISRKLVAETMRERKQRPLFLIDIAVPRDVEREVGSLSNVYLFDVDDLEQVVAENLKERRKELRAAERILEEELTAFERWLKTQGAVPVIKQLRERFTEVVRAEAEEAAQALRLEDGQREHLDAMVHAVVNKLLHAPTIELKKQVSGSNGEHLTQTVRELFQLPIVGDGPEEPPAAPEPAADPAAEDKP
jgi:glutamyl-tRNA reductase